MICSIGTPFTRVAGSGVGVCVGVGVKVGVAVAVAVGMGVAVAVGVVGIVAVAVLMKPASGVGCTNPTNSSVTGTDAEAAEPACPQAVTRIKRAKKMNAEPRP